SAPGVGERARGYLASIRAQPRRSEGALTEREGKHILAMYGIPTPREALATTADGAVMVARTLGLPVVLKVESPDILHKTEAGGVRVGLHEPEQVGRAFGGPAAAARPAGRGADVGGVLVQQMMAGGVEMMRGRSRAAAFGPTVAVGLGGVLVELLDDVQLGVPPLGADEAGAMLDGL